MADAKQLRERMAVVPQEARAVQWMTPSQTVTSYMMWRGLSYRESKRRTEEALGRVGLTSQADNFNRNLSGGMKRKLLVAMVMASEADLILLDEPSTGLDPISRQEAMGPSRRSRAPPFRSSRRHIIWKRPSR